MDAHSRRQLEHYARIAENYADTRLKSPAYSRFLDIWAAKLLEPWMRTTDEATRQKQKVLDPMCGHANMAPYLLLNSDHVYLNDLSPNMLAYIDDDIQNKCHVLLPCDVTALDLDDESMDMVVISGGLHHVHRNLARVLHEIHRVLKPGGLLLFGEPSNEFCLVRLARNLVYRISRSFEHTTERAFRWMELRGYLCGAGFSQVEIRPFGSVGYLLMGQVGVLRLLSTVDWPWLFRALSWFDRRIEKSKRLRITCFALVGSAIKTQKNGSDRRTTGSVAT